MSRLKAIAAIAENGVIGNGLKIPWHISEDFKHFKRTTMGGIVVMGRKTWESLGSKGLPGRENVVITSGRKPDGADKAYSSVAELIKAYESDTRTLWICGGAALYKSALPLCDELILSEVKMKAEGDIYFPTFMDKFSKVDILSTHPQFDVVRYIRRE